MGGPAPFTVGRIRCLLTGSGGSITDQISGGVPVIPVGTDVQFEIAYSFLGSLVDASQLASVTAAVKLLSNADTASIVSVTVTPSSAGWNSNPAMSVGQALVPSYASYVAAAGSSATGTAVRSGSTLASVTLGSGGSGYTVAPVVWVLSATGIGAVVTAQVAAGAVTGYTVVAAGSGYATDPTILVLPATTYSLGVQAGATYSWTIGANETALFNNGVLVAGSNLVNPASTDGQDYSSSAATLSGLTTGNYYYFVLGSNDVSVAGVAAGAPPYFLAASGTAALAGNGASALITAQVYPATAGKNVVPGSLSYPSSTLVASGSNLVPGATNYLAASGGASYGTYTLTGLTVGATYTYALGSNEPSSIGGVNGQTTVTGYFTATSTQVLLQGVPLAAITTKVFATTGAASSYTLTGLTIGNSYYWTQGNDTSVAGLGFTTLIASGFFTAAATSVVLTGPGAAAITSQVQAVTQTKTNSFVAATNTMQFYGTALAAVTATATGNAGWQQNTDQLCVVPLTHSQTNFSTPSGGSTNYWLLVSAVTTGGNDLILGAGQITALDNGNASNASVPGNLIGAVSYSGGGTYTLTGLTVGGVYYWGQGANDTNIAGTGFTTLTTSGNFVAGATSVTLTGTASQTVTAAVLPLQVSSPTGGQVAIPSGTAAGAYTVTGVTIPFTPARVTVTLEAGVNDAYVACQVIASTISQTGFHVNFFSAINTSNYVLSWDAHSY